MSEKDYTRKCYLCGKPSTGHVCWECFSKGKRRNLSRVYIARKNRNQKIKREKK